MDEEESNLVRHARTELELIGEDPVTIAGYLKIMQAFSDMGHSGGSASVAIPQINALLQFQNLAPITADPDEWFFHGPKIAGKPNGFWQSTRNPAIFSEDGGKTHYSVEDPNKTVSKSAPYS